MSLTVAPGPVVRLVLLCAVAVMINVNIIK